MTRVLGLLLFVAVGLVPALPVPAASEPGSETTAAGTVEDGLELFAAGRFDEALPLLRAAVVRDPDHPGNRAGILALARIFLDREQPGKALLYLERLPAAAADAPEVRLLRGLARVAGGEAEAGREQLLAVDPEDLEAADRRRRLRSLAAASAARGLRLEALTFLHRALPLDGAEIEALLHIGRRYLQGLDAAELDEAAFMFAATPLGADARLLQAERAERRGDLDTARRLSEELVHSRVDFPFRRQAVRLYERLTGESWQQPAVGVLLPLTGRYAAFGKLVRRGMELALAEDRTGRPVRFIFRDSAADPDISAEGVEDLLFAEGVMAIAGPLTGNAAEAAARRAQREGVPLLSLSQRDGLPAIGNQVFRNSLTTGQQARSLVRYAMEEQGQRQFGILHPENRLGREMADLFTAEVVARGGEVTARQGYPETATDFRRQIRLLMGKDPDAPAEEPPEPPGPLEALFIPDEPPVDFEALFIPDYADKIGLIAPQLPFYGLEGLPLLGINGWNSPELVGLAGPYVEGAVFVDGFFVHSSYPFVQDFVDACFRRFGEEPTILEAQGYDTAGILLQVLADPSVRNRDDVRRALQRLYNYPGVTGATSFTLDGEADKVLFLLQVRDGNIVQIN